MKTSSPDFIAPDNIHFAYDVDLGNFIFLDPILSDLFNADDPWRELINLINSDDLPVAKQAYSKIIHGTFNGSIKLRIGVDNSERWLNITPFYNRQLKIIYGCVVDISLEIENFDAISKYANKKNSILHMLAHDLRGPLSIAQSLVTQTGKQDERLTKRFAAVSTILKQSIDLITSLTDREFLEMTGNSLVKTRIDLVKKVNEYVEECRRSEDLADRIFELEVSDLTIMVDIDEAKFMQVINNLISNALKFTKPNGTIRVAVRKNEDHILLIISDNGIGIPAHLMPHLFDKFTIAARAGLNGEPTIGLGLSIVKKIIDWHEGEIWCESTEGAFTSFYIKFPLSKT